MSMWSCNATSNEGLVENLKRTGVVHSEAVFDAMIATDRGDYVAQDETPDGGHVGELDEYQDVPHPIGYHQTISAPHMHGHAMELGYAAIKDVQHPRILDVGAGSGYLTACFGRLVEKQGGHVFGIEIVPGLVQFAKTNIERSDGDLMDSGIVSLRCLNGWDGLPNEGPFHFIHVGAWVETPPQALMDQLVDGGQLVFPLVEARVGQWLEVITRHGTTFSQQRLFDVWNVPLDHERLLPCLGTSADMS